MIFVRPNTWTVNCNGVDEFKLFPPEHEIEHIGHTSINTFKNKP